VVLRRCWGQCGVNALAMRRSHIATTLWMVVTTPFCLPMSCAAATCPLLPALAAKLAAHCVPPLPRLPHCLCCALHPPPACLPPAAPICHIHALVARLAPAASHVSPLHPHARLLTVCTRPPRLPREHTRLADVPAALTCLPSQHVQCTRFADVRAAPVSPICLLRQHAHVTDAPNAHVSPMRATH
jgi:hypothetical protein